MGVGTRMPNRPCINCGTPARGTRCTACQAARDRARNQARPHYHGDYKTRAKQVRDQANADPNTRCWRCGGHARPGDPWQAGHLIDSDPTSPLAPEHRSCNTRAGASLRHHTPPTHTTG